jgi:hypothetical protein
MIRRLNPVSAVHKVIAEARRASDFWVMSHGCVSAVVVFLAPG